MAKRIAFLFIAILLSLTSFGQKQYARVVVDTLASPYMGGRGYVDDGNARAAKYIKGQFMQLGLLPFVDSFLQKFDYSVNTYPDPYNVIINDRLTEPGADYIIMPSTPHKKETFL